MKRAREAGIKTANRCGARQVAGNGFVAQKIVSRPPLAYGASISSRNRE